MSNAQQSANLAARQAAQQEQQAEIARYYEAVNLLQGDAARNAEARQRESFQQLQADTIRAQERVQALKQKSLILSAENVSKQELIESMSTRLTDLSTELNRMTRSAALSTAVHQTDDQRIASFTTLFDATMERAVRQSSAAKSNTLPAELLAKTAGTGPRTTKVYYTPDNQPREVAAGVMEMRLGRGTTFREVCVNAARYFGEEPTESVLLDEHGTVWPFDVAVSREIARYRGDQTIRLVRREEEMADGHGGAKVEDEDEEHDVNGLVTMLGGSGNAAGSSTRAALAMGGELGDEGDDGAKAAAAAAAALAAMEDSDSDDDDLQKKEYVEPPLNRRREYFDMGLHMLFLVLLFQSISEKRALREAYALTESLQTIFVDEEFGDFNEKTFMDVRNFEEAWEWTNGVLVEGLFDSDVDDTGNIMMYNQLVGAIRLRQLRVSNTSCELSPLIQREVQVAGQEFTQSFVFQAPNFGDGGSCFFTYSGATRDTTDFGPCTPEGREALQGVPDLSEETLNMWNETCGGPDPSSGSGFKYYPESVVKAPRTILQDGGGYVRDVRPDEPLPGADIPRVPRSRMVDELDKLLKMRWLDERTRAMIISFSVYNANFNLYAACMFSFVFSPGGTIKPIPRFKVMKIDLYEGVEEMSQMMNSVEVQYDAAVMLLLFRLIIKELSRYIYIRWNFGTSKPYITNIWNMLEIANITPFIIAWSLRAQFVSNPLRTIYSIGMFATRYAELGPVADSYVLAFCFDSMSIVVSFLKLFKYFRLFDATALLWNVLESSAADMSYFFFMLVLFLLAFTLFAEQIFGPTLILFSTPLLSMTALLNQIFGVVDIYWEMVRTAQERMLAIGFFFGFTILMFFILVNVFLAILNDAYSSVKGARDERIAQQKAEKEELERENPPESFGQRIVRLQRAARGRFHRFSSRVNNLARRRKVKPMTATDAFESLYTAPPRASPGTREATLKTRRA